MIPEMLMTQKDILSENSNTLRVKIKTIMKNGITDEYIDLQYRKRQEKVQV